jgi:hypothetical protein
MHLGAQPDQVGPQQVGPQRDLEAGVPHPADVQQHLAAAVGGRGKRHRDDGVHPKLPVRRQLQGNGVAEQVRVDATLELGGSLRLELGIAELVEDIGVHAPAVPPRRGPEVEPQPVRRPRLNPGLAIGGSEPQCVEDLLEGKERLVGDQIRRRHLGETGQRLPRAVGVAAVQAKAGRKEESRGLQGRLHIPAEGGRAAALLVDHDLAGAIQRR